MNDGHNFFHMIFRKCFLVFSFLIAGISNVAIAQNLLISNVNMIDVKQGIVIPGQHILIENGLIKKISSKAIKSSFKEVKGDGKFLIPGLIDGYVSLYNTGGLYGQPEMLNLNQFKSIEEVRKTSDLAFETNMKRHLSMGITSVMDRGGPLHQLEHRVQITDKDLPNLFITGPVLALQPVPTYMGRPETAPMFQAGDPTLISEMIYKQMPLDPDYIVLSFLNSAAEGLEERKEVLKKAIVVSKLNRLATIVNVSDVNGAKIAVKLGADVIIGGIVSERVDDELLRLMKEANVSYVPALSASDRFFNVINSDNLFSTTDLMDGDPFELGTLMDLQHLVTKDERIKEVIDVMRESLPDLSVIRGNLEYNARVVSAYGIPIVLGSGAGNMGSLHGVSLFSELQSLSKAGLKNEALLRSVTIGPAGSMNVITNIGFIGKGYKADLVLLSENPLEDIGNLKSRIEVIKDGRIIKTENLLAKTPASLVQKQLNAYNSGEIDAFMEPFANNVKVFTFPNQPLFSGKEFMKRSYETIFRDNAMLHCELVNRIINGNTIIDRERITGLKKGEVVEAIVIYKIKKNKIAEVYFIN